MDREKVIKEFEHLLNAAKGNYQDFVDLTVDGGEEILALLKEQEDMGKELETAKPWDGYTEEDAHRLFSLEKHGEWQTIWDRNDPDTSSEARCSVCGRVSERPLGHYCKWCGSTMDKE